MILAGRFVEKRYMLVLAVIAVLALATITFLAMHTSMGEAVHMAVFNRRGPVVAVVPHVFNRR